MDSLISLDINGQKHVVNTDPSRPLLEVLREDLGLTGTRFGCGEGECGACSVLLEGKRIFSCLTPVSEMVGKSIITIEGLANGDVLHPLQQAFMDEGAFQCAYCTSGMIMAACALITEKPGATEPEIREGMNGNLCRCCGYGKIVSAIRRVTGSQEAVHAKL